MSENLTQDPARNDAEPEQPTDVESTSEHDESVSDVVEADVQAITGGDVDADTLDTASDVDVDVTPAASTSRQGQLVASQCSQSIAGVWGCPLRWHPTAGHDLPLDDPQWVIDQIQQWVDQGG